ncbi:MAG: carboxypeptidase regulatory-like domain-containing protein, partial [Pseudolysinimonas sp.]
MAAVGALGLGALLLTGAGAVQATPTGTVAGVVMAGAVPVAGEDVSIFDQLGADIPAVTTQPNGAFTFTGLALGTYSLSVAETDDHPRADVPNFTLTSAKPTRNVTILIPPYLTGTASLAGTVVDGATGDPLAGASVFVSGVEGVRTGLVDVAADGSWTAGNLLGGGYSVSVDVPGYVSKSSTVNLPDRGHLDLPIELLPADATITGDVLDGDGVAVPGASVEIRTSDPDVQNASLNADDDTGQFEAAVAAGDYTVIFDGRLLGFALSEQPVAVAAGASEVVHFIATDRNAGSISGRATTSSGAGLASICVSAIDPGDGSPQGEGGPTDSTGAFTVSNLDAGTYSLQFGDCSSRATPYASVFEGGAVALLSPATVAKQIVLAQGANVAGRVQKMVPGAIVSGTVSQLTGDGVSPLPLTHGILYSLYANVAGSWVEVAGNSNFGSTPGGQFKIRGILPGTYRLGFHDTAPAPSLSFHDRYWTGSDSIDSASNLTLTSGQKRTGLALTVSVPRPLVDPVPADESLVTDYQRGITGAPATAKQGAAITVAVGAAHAGEWVSVWAFSTPTAVSDWVRVGKSGTVNVTVPAGLPSGDHKLVVQSAGDGVLGWSSIHVAGGAYPAAADGTVVIDDSTGTSLTGITDSWPVGTTFAGIQWFRASTSTSAGAAIAGATHLIYTPVAADFGKLLRLRVTAAVPGYAPTMRLSDSLDVTLRTTAGSLTLNGEVKLNSELTLADTLEYADLNGVQTPTSAYQWLSNGVPISGQTGQSFTPTTTFAGKRISVRVTLAMDRRVPLVVSSAATQPLGANAFTGWDAELPPLTMNTATNTLSAGGTGIIGTTPTVAYQWFRGDAAISGATKASYKLASA